MLTAYRILVREDRPRALLAFALIFAGRLSAPLVALMLAGLTDAAGTGRTTAALVYGAVAGALSVVLLTAGHFAHNVMAVLGERAAVTVDRELIAMVHGSPYVANQENPEYADRLQLLREHVGALAFTVSGSVGAAATVVQIAVSIALLGHLDPALTALPLIAVAPFMTNRIAHRLENRARMRVAPQRRRAHALLDMSYQQGSAMEVRLAGLGDELRARQRSLFGQAARELTAAELRGAIWSASGQVFFAVAYAAALLLVVRDVIAGHGTVGSAVLAVVLARQINAGVGQILTLARTVQEAARLGEHWHFVRGRADGTREPTAGQPAPRSIVEGMRIDGLRFRYPGTGTDILAGLTAELPAGAVVAVVGENGAGKTTLVKVLCRFYEPTEGTIAVDGTQFADIGPRAWQGAVTAAFQDFVRFEFPALQAIGIGWLPRVDDRPAVMGAARRAGAQALVEGLPHGLDTELGTSFPNGHGLSTGQWQKIALARAAMPSDPLLVVLDEPSAALDAAAEHALFERQAELARSAAAAGAITLLISHRFSTVSMADLILVLDAGRIVERGTHRELLDAGGVYADLFALQASGYRDDRRGLRDGA